jgi:hypothetical protein
MGNESSTEEEENLTAIDCLSWKFVATPQKFVHVAVSQFTVVCVDVNGMVWMLHEHLLHSKSWIKLPGNKEKKLFILFSFSLFWVWCYSFCLRY